MTQDRLDLLVAAYREEHHSDALNRRGIKRRLLLSLSHRRKLRLRSFQWGIAVGVALVGSASLAAASAGPEAVLSSVVTWFHQRAPDVPIQAADMPIAARTPRWKGSTQPHQRPLPEPERLRIAQLEDLPLLKDDHEEEPAANGGDLHLDVEIALYRIAHRLHYGAGDPRRALSAWDAYLEAFPAGSLAYEARFNRALCLIKIGRVEQAERALEQLVRGRSGSRQHAQAKALLAAIREN